MESRLQNGTFIYKMGFLLTKCELYLQNGILALQMGISDYNLSTELKVIIRSTSASFYIGTKEFSIVCLSVCYVVSHVIFCSKRCLFHILVDPCNDCTPVYRVSCRKAPNGRRY